MKKIKSLEQLEQFRKEIQAQRDPKKTVISICGGTGCLALGSKKIAAALKEEIQSQGLTSKVELSSIKETGCPGFCERGPIVVIYPEETCYLGVTAKDVPDIISKTIANNEIIERLVYKDPDTKERIVKDSEIPFYKKQQRYLLGNNIFIDSKSIEDYISLGGYSALAKVLSAMKPDEVIQEVIDANLRGRGGGGFPAGWKWHSTRKAEGNPKYVICNADEGDPGAFMDRALLEGNPHSVLEGMIIGAYAIGSNEGYIYVRNEYPLAVTNATLALDQARESGFLGENILGSGFSFDIKIMRGGGAFVCGESSALFASLEGRSGEPRAKYIHATDRGLWDKPTNLNNVETWANVPLIISKGAQWYSNIGTEGSKGTKIFSVVGKIKNTGLVEVPMGITLREIIYDIGGGIPNGKMFKAVQTGGPSGGCIPEVYLDTPVDFDELTRLGSMMGSGGMIVMDEENCMVDVANYFLKFLEEESCGKCTPCREGILQMRKILDRITSGEGRDEDLDTLEWMGQAIIDGSLCALGGAAPNPVITTMRYFRDEYEAHIREKRCPAGVCKALIRFSIDPENCNGCHLCARICPVEAAKGIKKEVHTIDDEICIKCRACYEVCKFDAVKIR
jgi:NADH:ubiquinone oxidoreductase subunit F (NADH-binding)/(2Fe-2S) ferredoxin/Pyruvate/2-oxoacid:ferredoxin oxidoreductase delta subunit